MSSFFEDLQWRGLVHQVTDPEHFAEWIAKPRVVYAGFDPTSDSLHAGSLLPLMLLRRFQRAGHQPIAVVGGATGMIGDPSGKSAERNLLDVETLQRNVDGMARQMKQFLDFDQPQRPALLLNNFDWIRGFSYLEFLRDVGKNFPVNVMLAKDSVKSRLGRDDVGISYTEFSYMLLQAYDFVYLHQRHGCELQVGGSDQWGNITAGVDLGRRMHGAQLQGMTCPLLTKTDGSKMGKTESGAVWLSPEKTSPYAFYQYWKNVADDDVEPCLKVLTELPRAEIEALAAERAAAPHERTSQTRLAQELTRMVHGAEGLALAEKATAFFFGGEISGATDRQLQEIFHDVPSSAVERSVLAAGGLSVIDALCAAQLAKSKSDARRTIEQGGAYVNNRRIDDVDARLSPADLASESFVVLRSGRKRYALLRIA
ncbi:MAG: tyrosine--tRNA ligase [Pirellulales bacterium]